MPSKAATSDPMSYGAKQIVCNCRPFSSRSSARHRMSPGLFEGRNLVFASAFIKSSRTAASQFVLMLPQFPNVASESQLTVMNVTISAGSECTTMQEMCPDSKSFMTGAALSERSRVVVGCATQPMSAAKGRMKIAINRYLMLSNINSLRNNTPSHSVRE
jgi:hypothetical protein